MILAMNRFSAISILVFSVAVTCLSPAFAFDPPTGWRFDVLAKDSAIRAHNDQIGTLRELKESSAFLSVPVIVEPAKGLNTQSATFQLSRLDSSVKKIMLREKNQPSFISKKINGGRPVIEAEYGKPGKGFTWIYSRLAKDKIVTLIGESRGSSPGAGVREEFFAMARDFTPP